MSEAQSNELKQIQQRVDDQLAKVWTKEQKTRIEELQNMFGGGPGFGPPGGFGPPPGFGPPGGPGGPGPRGDRVGRGGPGRGGPGGIFRCYLYGTDFPGFAGKELKPGKKLEEVASAMNRRPPTDRPDAKK